MTRRFFRSSVQLSALAFAVFLLVVLLDRQLGVLPQTIHNRLPAHHDGLVITDVTVKICSALNPFSSCALDPAEWSRLEKDLYLKRGWVSQAYIHIKRKREEELVSGEKVVVDVKVGRLDPSAAGDKAAKSSDKWESRPAGIWILRSAKKHESDSKGAVTSVDVLFGADAVEVRPGWTIREIPLLLDAGAKVPEAHLSVHTGQAKKTEKPTPRIKKDGKFKILQLADLHLSTGIGHCRDPEPAGEPCDGDTRTLDFVHRILDDEEPDLVVLSGDQVNGDSSPDPQSAIFKSVELLVKRSKPIPYAAIFGNHDDEATPMSRGAQMELLETLPHSLAEAGPVAVDGVGNYVVEVLAHGSSHSALSLYFLDSHSYSPDEKKYHGYDWVKETQIHWLHETAQSNRRKHKDYSKIHLDMAFLHIPLPEYRDESNLLVGEWREPPTAPNFNTHFRDALVEEGIHVVSCGHDHVNDYCALPKAAASDPDSPDALWMCYGGGAGFGGYGGWGGYTRRVRLFEIDTSTAKITTWKRLEHGELDKRVDVQTLTQGGKVFHSSS